MTERRDAEERQNEQTREAVRARYAQIASGRGSCCGDGSGCCAGEASSCCADGEGSAELGYTREDLSAVPEGANLGLGCGNPAALLSLGRNESVLDLGSGAGVDCFIAARRVGPGGKVIGVDMTAEMIARARENARRFGASNVEFRLGEIEHLPVADQEVDVVLSNCVINLVPDKSRVYREAFRVLRPGGRLAVSDLVATMPISGEARRDLDQWSGCSAGALTVSETTAALEGAGFVEIKVALKASDRTPDSLDSPGRLGVVAAAIVARRPEGP